MSKSIEPTAEEQANQAIIASLEADARRTRTVADTAELADLSALIAEAQTAQAEVEQLKEELADASKRLARYQADLLPSALDAAGVQAFRTADGLQVSVMPHYAATLAKHQSESASRFVERRALAFDYLRRTGNEGLIKNELTITIPRGGDDVARQIRAVAIAHKLEWQLGETVHPSTLVAFLRERIEGATDEERCALVSVLEGLFRLSVFRRASIKPARG